MTWLTIMEYLVCVTNDHRYVPLVVTLPGPFLIHDLQMYHRVCN